MNNYKIKVNGTHPKAYQEILDVAVELGYTNEDWGNLYNLNYLFLNDDGSVGFSLNGEAVSDDHQELTLPQLRDLVVLHHNDVKDANYTYSGKPVLKLETQDYKVWDSENNVWTGYIGSQTDLLRGIKPIQSEPEQGLISEADALRALADGEEVQYSYKSKDIFFNDLTPNSTIRVDEIFSGQHFIFRLKPRTITLSLEIPAPFEPKVGDIYWFVAMTNLRGYTQKTFRNDGDDECIIHLGAWRTEEEIKQVVAALRGGIKG